MDLNAIKTQGSRPASATSSPGLYSPAESQSSKYPAYDAGTPAGSPYLHPLQMHKVKETHKAEIENDHVTGRKMVNQYEILGEIGRGVHGKVKLAKNQETGDQVAIKIIQRFSKKRRLGKVTVSPEGKTKREIAILKKIRHPNVVGLYEVIDDPELNKIYMVLEFVELGEIKWRRKGDPRICAHERRRIERELRGEDDNGESETLFKMMERRRAKKDARRAKRAQQPNEGDGFWSLEHGNDEDDHDVGDVTPLSRVSTQESIFMPSSFQSHRSHMSHTSLIRSGPSSASASRNTSRAPSRADSSVRRRSSRPIDYDIGPIDSDNEEETPGPLPSLPSTHSSGAGLHAHLHAYANRSIDATAGRDRSPSVADSFVSNMSSIDDVVQHDSFEDDFSYVPCFTLEQARSTFRDTVLGLEYLHYEGIVHRDIKPANLLWTREHRVKISDFGVSYFGRPIRDGEPGDVSESDAHDFDDDLELSKTVGTPAFFAPELCYTDLDTPQPKINDQIDVWSLGVTLYCLIFARIPFLAEDEYQLFRAIAQQDVYIPRRRLKAIDPGVEYPDNRIPEFAYRNDNELVMENVDDELYDLLRRMLVKDPAERIKLREVKRHPWVLRGIDNVIGWLDDTDPSRRTSGQRIQVDDRELERAVIPLSFVERARSAVKKAVGKVLGRSDGSRKRATSTATSSGDGGRSSPQTPAAYDRDARRRSFRGDDSYFSPMPDHPLSQSVTCSPEHQPLQGDDMDVSSKPLSIPQQISHQHTNSYPDNQRKGFLSRPAAPNRSISTAATIKGYMPRSPLPSPRGENQGSSMFSPDIMTTFTDHFGGAIRDTIRLKNIRSMDLMKDDKADETNRARSADRAAKDKHASSTTGLTRAVAEAKHLFGHSHSKSTSDTRSTDHPSPDHPYVEHPLPQRPALSNHKPSLSSPIIGTLNYAAMKLDSRPVTATRHTEVRTPPRLWEPTTPDSLQREQEQIEAYQRLQNIGVSRQPTPVETRSGTQSGTQSGAHTPTKSYPASPWASPRTSTFAHSRYDESGEGRSSSSVNSYANRSPAENSANASNLASPLSSATLSSEQNSSQDQFPSHPSLPALVSGASSVSADHDSDTLTQSSVHTLMPEHRGSPDTLTKFNSNDEPVVLGGNKSEEEVRREMYNDNQNFVSSYEPPNHFAREEDSESDSDEGLTMGRRKKPASTPASKEVSPGKGSPGRRDRGSGGPWERTLQRRNTNGSVGSTGTAKKIEMSD